MIGHRRRVCRKLPDGTFEDVEFRDLRKGDEFTMFENDGDAVDGGRLFKAETDASPLGDGEEYSWGIKVEDGSPHQENRCESQS